LMGITPTCCPSALISRTSGTLICSLILTLCCFWMAVTSLNYEELAGDGVRDSS